MYSAFGVDHGSEIEKKFSRLSLTKPPVDDAVAAQRRAKSAKSGLFGDQRASTAYDSKLTARREMRGINR